MDTVTLFDAKNRLSALIDQVEDGQEIAITRRGKPVARLVPIVPEARTAKDAIAKLIALRERIAARGEVFTREELAAYRDEGRR